MEWLLPRLLELDRELFVFINGGMTNSVLDQTMPIVTDLHKQPLFWVFIAAWIIVSIFRARPTEPSFTEGRKLRAKKWLCGVLILGASMGLSDFVAYRGIKVWVQRDRPEAAGVPVVLRTQSHSGWSFPSNHAANNFALARTVQILAPSYAIPAYAFASLVGFSRTYVGVHYPLDVLAGGTVGFTCASLIGALARWARARWQRRRTSRKEDAT